MKEKILEFIKNMGHTTFAELDRIDGFRGDYVFTNEKLGEMNIYMWFSCSNDATAALCELLSEKKIAVHPTSWLTYMIDGLIPNVPVAKSARKYKKDRWTPVAFTYEVK